MSNSTSASASFVDTIADSFLRWFQSDILPVCFAIVDILVIIVGLVLNILLITTFRKRGLFVEPSSHFLLMMIIVDFISYVFLLIPNIISAFAKEWILSEPVCRIHGAALFFAVFSTFGFTTILSIERTVKLCYIDGQVYDKLFNNEKVRAVMNSVVWGVAALVAFLPATGVGDINYDFYHQGCKLDYTTVTGQPFLIVHFLLTCVFPTIVVIVSYSLIFRTRHKAVLEERLSNFKAVNTDKTRGRNTTTSSIADNPLPSISEHDEEVFTEKNGTIKKTTPQAFTDDKKEPPSLNTKTKGCRPKSPPRQSMLFEVFSDDEENPAFHLALTYLYVWATVYICYLPYVIVCFYGAFNDGPLWGGFYTVTLLVVHVNFTVKPVVYLGHNRHYRHVTKQTIPEGMRNRARSMRTSISSFTDTVEDFVFKSNGNKKLNAALATQKAVLIWKKKLRKRKGIVKLTNEPEMETTVDSTSLMNKSDLPTGKTDTINVVNGAQNPKSGQSINHSFATAGQNRMAVTPSDVLIAPTQSSFIERERLKLLNMASSGGSATRESPDSASPVPGMVDDQERKLLGH